MVSFCLFFASPRGLSPSIQWTYAMKAMCTRVSFAMAFPAGRGETVSAVADYNSRRRRSSFFDSRFSAAATCRSCAAASRKSFRSSASRIPGMVFTP